MQNLIRRGNTWFARAFIPKDRWADVGGAMGAAGGVKREVVRTLGTTDRREAKRRLQPALAAIQATVDADLKAAGLAPLSDWTADWATRAVGLRAELRAAKDTPLDGSEAGESERDLVLDSIRAEAKQLQEVKGPAAAGAFFKAVTTDQMTISQGVDEWLAEVAKTRRGKTVAGHRKVFSDLDAFIRRSGHYQHRSLATMTFSDVTRRMAGDFVEWRAGKVSAVAVQREVTAPMGLWRWAIRRGHTELNPWTDQTAGMRGARSDGGEPTKRAFTTPELVVLLKAKGTDWAPNGGGYGATLWDAVRLALLTGLRAGELADLRIRDLIDERTVISVPKGKTKNARRFVPLPQAAQRVIQARIAELPNTSPDAPLWPEIPVTRLTASRGGKLSDVFRMARPRLLPDAENVDLHSLRRSYATALEAAMNASGRVNPAIIASLMGQARGTMALDRYSSGASLKVLVEAVADLEALGLGEDVSKALTHTASQRPPMIRFKPVGAEPNPTDGKLL